MYTPDVDTAHDPNPDTVVDVQVCPYVDDIYTVPVTLELLFELHTIAYCPDPDIALHPHVCDGAFDAVHVCP